MPFRDILPRCLLSDFSCAVRSGAQPVLVARPKGLLVVGSFDRIARHSVLVYGRGERLFVVVDARTGQEMRRRASTAVE